MVEQVVGLQFVVKGEREAADALKRVSDKQSKLSNDIMRGAERVRSLGAEWDRANRYLADGTLKSEAHSKVQIRLAREYALLNNMVKANGALNTQAALAQMRAAQAAREAAAADAAALANKQRLTQSYNQLLASINPVIAAQQRTRQTVDMLRAAVAAGAITTTQAAQALLQYRASLRALDGGLNQTRLGLNSTAVVVQQAGYQVGDFFVQVQSGTNVLVAFGQQATQLIGTFAMLARTTRMIAIFSGLGVLVAIGTAIGAALMRASGASETLTQSLEKTKSSADKVKETFDIISDSELDKKFGNMSDEVKALAAAMLDLDSSAQLRNLSQTLEKLEKYSNANVFEKFFKGMASGLTFGMAGAGAAEVDETAFERLGFQMSRSQYLGYMEGLKSAAETGDREGVVRLFNQFIQDAGSDVSATGYAVADSIRTAAIATAELVAKLNGSAEASERASDAESRRVEYIKLFHENLQRATELENERNAAVQGILKTRDDELSRLEDQLRLNRAILQFGKDSVEVATAQAVLDRKGYEDQQRANGILGNNLRTVMAIYDENAKVTAEISASEDKAKGLSDALKEAASAMSALSGFSAGLDRALAVSVAKVQALKSGADAAVAGQIAGMQIDLESRMGAATAAGIDRGIVERMFGGDREKIAQIAASEAERKRLEEANRAASRTGRGGGGTGGNVIDINEIIAQRREQIAQERVLLNLSGQQRMEKEIYFDLLKQNADADVRLTDQQLRAEAQFLASQQQINEVMEERKRVQESLAATIESSMTDAFMSIVDGTKSTKDAFRDMARSIIAELYKVLVVQRIVGSFDSATKTGTGIVGAVMSAFQADGGAWRGGNVIPFANGGVVGGPTTFAMSGGRTGLMGEAGPEAIMPLKRGKDGKLGVAADGGGGGVTVQNVINVSGGDNAAAVRAEVAKLMPTITQATKSAVIDARRRGGQMKAAFG
jgi:hypothetical protein